MGFFEIDRMQKPIKRYWVWLVLQDLTQLLKQF